MYCAWSRKGRIALASDDCVVAIYKSDIDRIQTASPESDPIYGSIIQGQFNFNIDILESLDILNSLDILDSLHILYSPSLTHY